jgi:hypothetical protein
MRCEMMKDFDEAWLKHRTACEIAKKMRDKGVDISFIKEMTNLSEKKFANSNCSKKCFARRSDDRLFAV